jgi:hypothetical protein
MIGAEVELLVHQSKQRKCCLYQLGWCSSSADNNAGAGRQSQRCNYSWRPNTDTCKLLRLLCSPAPSAAPLLAVFHMSPAFV